MSEREWTVEQAAELFAEGMLGLLVDFDDDDTTAPKLVVEAFRQAAAPDSPPVTLDDELTVAEFRARLLRARGELARRDAG